MKPRLFLCKMGLIPVFELIIFGVFAVFSEEKNGTTQGEEKPVVYRAELKPINGSKTGSQGSGTATLTRKGDTLFVQIQASGLSPSIMHLQHYHGFPDGKDATCATMEQDSNNDSIIDLIETEVVSGITMVPFHNEPHNLSIASKTYPVADDQGNLYYNDTIQISKLQKSLQKRFGVDSLYLENKVIYIHGVSPDTKLPQTVQSLPDVPAHITLPVVCGKLQRMQ